MKQQPAFTLIELSIVLVIIGLIVGGVLMGQDLIRAAGLRSVITDWQKFDTALQTFRLKYNCLPGDCSRATTFGLGNNGDNSRNISNPSVDKESWLYWRHLANAGLLEGSYTGTNGSNNPNSLYDAVLGENIPESSINGVGYMVWRTVGYNSNLGEEYSAEESHWMVTGKDVSTGNFGSWGGAFRVNEMVSLDQKIDDGVAYAGKVRAHIAWADHDSLGCTTGTAPNYAYNSGNDSSVCTAMYYFRL